jgi:hypothetical protein
LNDFFIEISFTLDKSHIDVSLEKLEHLFRLAKLKKAEEK